MARSISLSRGVRFFLSGAGVAVVLAIGSSLPLAADPPKPAASTSTNAPPVAPAPPKTPNLPPPPVVPPSQDLNRYGKILAPSDDAAHPLKLNLSFPGVGEMKIPSQDEINMRATLEQLAILSDDDIRKKLSEWPPYAKMKLGDEGQLLIRIQQFKDLRTQIAIKRAHDLGLTLPPDQQARFEKEYWSKRLQMDRDLVKQFDPIFKARDQKMKEELFREFTSNGTVVPPPPPPAPGAKPPAPSPAQAAPLAQAKPAPTTPPPPASGTGGPVVGQGMAH